MGAVKRVTNSSFRSTPSWTALAAIAVLVASRLQCARREQGGGAPERAPDAVTTLTFASADPLPVDATFETLVAQDSGGHLKLRIVNYNARSPEVDVMIAAALQKGRLDVGDVGSRAWESLGVEAFRAYQDPFLVTSRELLDRAVTGPVAAGLLGTLKPAMVTGLAIVPDSIRYLFSTKPLTTLAQFHGAKIQINESDTTSEVIENLGATPVSDFGAGPPTVEALRSGELTAIESDPVNAMLNGYVQVAPYAVVNAPLFAKSTTFAASSSVLARLPKADASSLREAAQQAALRAAGANGASDRLDWVTMCAQGLKPLAVGQQQFNALHDAEAATYVDLAGDTLTALAVDRIGLLATMEPRMDSWASCHGIGVGMSPTKVLDGTYGVTISQADVVASGDCADCGNAGKYMLIIHDGRYAILHPKPWPDANPDETSVADQAAWGPDDPVEVGTISIVGNRATFVPDTSQANGSATTVYTFELFRGLLTWHLISGTGFDTTSPWRQLS